MLLPLKTSKSHDNPITIRTYQTQFVDLKHNFPLNQFRAFCRNCWFQVWNSKIKKGKFLCLCRLKNSYWPDLSTKSDNTAMDWNSVLCLKCLCILITFFFKAKCSLVFFNIASSLLHYSENLSLKERFKHLPCISYVNYNEVIASLEKMEVHTNRRNDRNRILWLNNP